MRDGRYKNAMLVEVMRLRERVRELEAENQDLKRSIVHLFKNEEELQNINKALKRYRAAAKAWMDYKDGPSHTTSEDFRLWKELQEAEADLNV